MLQQQEKKGTWKSFSFYFFAVPFVNRGKSKTWTAYDILEEVLDNTAEPTPEDIAGMLKAVLERTRPKESVQESSDDDDDD